MIGLVRVEVFAVAMPHCIRVHYVSVDWRMKNITLSADEQLIEAARERARQENSTLNAEFRSWLESYTGRKAQAEQARHVLRNLRSRVSTGGRRFTREEMNER